MQYSLADGVAIHSIQKPDIKFALLSDSQQQQQKSRADPISTIAVTDSWWPNIFFDTNTNVRKKMSYSPVEAFGAISRRFIKYLL